MGGSWCTTVMQISRRSRQQNHEFKVAVKTLRESKRRRGEEGRGKRMTSSESKRTMLEHVTGDSRSEGRRVTASFSKSRPMAECVRSYSL